MLTATEFAVSATDLVKIYGAGDGEVRALDGVSAGFVRGQFTAIMGPSGSGKSTFMHCLAGLDSVTSGQIMIGDRELTGLNDRALTAVRRDRIGFVFQAFNLLPQLTAEQNITLPAQLAGNAVDRAFFDHVIGVLGIQARLRHRPSELSGGQQQRVALARALVTRPDVIFADEPTGNLDSRSGAEVLGFLLDCVHRLGQTVVMVTHHPGAAVYADRVLVLADGRLVHDIDNPTLTTVAEAVRGPVVAR